MLVLLLITIPCVVISYILRLILPESMWIYALGVLSFGLSFYAGWYTSVAEQHTPYEQEIDKTVFPVLLFFIAVVLPVYAMNRVFHSPVNPSRFSSLVALVGLLVVFRIGNEIEIETPNSIFIDAFSLAFGNVLNPALNDMGPFVFVSYKSQDATAVRKVVEQLMSRGMNIWFAEHHVLLTNYGRFQRAIDHAIAHSHHAIVFTNNDWAKSEYVEKEMKQILDWGAPERVVEVRVPVSNGSIQRLPHEKYGEFTAYDSFDLADQDDSLTLLKKIETIVTGEEVWRGRPLPLAGLMACGPLVVHPLTGYGIKVGPFTEDRTVFPKLDDSVGGWDWVIDVEKEVGLIDLEDEIDLIDPDDITSPINEEDAVGPVQVKMLACMRRGLLSVGKISEEEMNQDRRLYHMYRKHARRWVDTGFIRHKSIKTKGLHLIQPDCSGTVAYDRRIPPAQFGLTYLTKSKTGLNSWERRYEYALPDPDGPKWLELDLIFWLKLSPVNKDKEYRAFLRLTPLFDCIAESLTFRPELRRESGPNAFVPQ